jgi:hypothetical protein
MEIKMSRTRLLAIVLAAVLSMGSNASVFSLKAYASEETEEAVTVEQEAPAAEQNASEQNASEEDVAKEQNASEEDTAAEDAAGADVADEQITPEQITPEVFRVEVFRVEVFRVVPEVFRGPTLTTLLHECIFDLDSVRILSNSFCAGTQYNTLNHSKYQSD